MRTVLPAVALSLVLSSIHLAAQARTPAGVEVTGRVVDGTTGAPVAAAVIELRDVHRKAVSDTAGRFVLAGVAPGTHEWAITRMGYAAWQESAEVADGDEFTIGLLAKPEVLRGITAVASQLVQRRESSGVKVEALDAATLRLSPAATVADLVRDRFGLAGRPCPSADVPVTCASVRGEMVPVAVFIDEQRAPGGLADLANLVPQELYGVEAYAGGVVLRVFTTQYAERLSRGRAHLLPLGF